MDIYRRETNIWFILVLLFGLFDWPIDVHSNLQNCIIK